MWKALLCFAGHRVLLVVTAVLAVQYASPEGRRQSPVSVLYDRISQLPEVTRLEGAIPLPGMQLFQATKDPYLMIQVLLARITGIPVPWILFLLSNIVFLLFLWELYKLLCRSVLPEVADGAVLLAILWPASYEFSLGTTYGMPCFLAIFALRQAIDDRWAVAGPALAVLSLMEPWTVGLWLPLLVAFWLSNKHLEWTMFARRALFLLWAPTLAAVWNWAALSGLPGDMSQSALAKVFDIAVRGGPGAWTFSNSYVGQTITIVLFLLGAAGAFGGMQTWLQRMMPLYLLFLVVAFTQYKDIGSRILFAAPALQGLSSHLARPLLSFLQTLLLLGGIYEVFVLFSRA